MLRGMVDQQEARQLRRTVDTLEARWLLSLPVVASAVATFLPVLDLDISDDDAAATTTLLGFLVDPGLSDDHWPVLLCALGLVAALTGCVVLASIPPTPRATTLRLVRAGAVAAVALAVLLFVLTAGDESDGSSSDPFQPRFEFVTLLALPVWFAITANLARDLVGVRAPR